MHTAWTLTHWPQGQGRNHGWKVKGAKVWVPTPGHLRPAKGWVLGAGEGQPLPLWGSEGITLGKFLKTQDAKYCILVTTVLISELSTTCISKKLEGPIHCWSPNLNVRGTILPRWLRLLRLCAKDVFGRPSEWMLDKRGTQAVNRHTSVLGGAVRCAESAYCTEILNVV